MLLAVHFLNLTNDYALPIPPSDFLLLSLILANKDPQMLCQGFKGGTGSASRVIKGKVMLPEEAEKEVEYTVAALVQVNYGAQWDLHIGHVPVGKLLMDPEQRAIWESNPPGKGSKEDGKKKDGSIIVIIATDAPMRKLTCSFKRRISNSRRWISLFQNTLIADHSQVAQRISCNDYFLQLSLSELLLLC